MSTNYELYNSSKYYENYLKRVMQILKNETFKIQ